MNREQCPSTIDLWPEVVAERPRRDVAQHVARCGNCRQRIAEARRKLSILRALGGASRETLPPPADNSDRDNRLPDRIGDCPVLGLLGQGGQSVVYRAWHPRLNAEIA